MKYRRSSASGSVVILTLAFLLAMTLQILLMGTVVTRTLSLESSTQSQSVAAKEAADTGIERLHQALISYSAAGTLTTATALSVFGSGQAQAITNASISVTDPETGLSASTPVTISAYVGQARGDMYELISTATYRDTVITSRKWIQLSACSAGAASNVTLLTTETNSNDNTVGWATDPVNKKVYFNTSTGIKRASHNGTTLNTAGSWQGFLDVTTGDYYTHNSVTQNELYRYKLDGTISTISESGDIGEFVVDPTTGYLYFYHSDGSDATWGIYRYVPATGVVSRMVTLNLDSYGSYSLFVVPSNGRLFFVHNDTTARPVYSWQAATGLTTVISLVKQPLMAFAMNPNTGRIFFSDYNGGADVFYSWLHGDSPSALTTLTTNLTATGNLSASVDVARDSVYFMGYAGSSSRVMGWSAAGGLTTILDRTSDPKPDTATGIIDNSSGNYYFRMNDDSMRMYNPANGAITTVTTNAGYGSMMVPASSHLLVNNQYIAPIYDSGNNWGSTRPNYNKNDTPVFGTGSSLAYLISVEDGTARTYSLHVYNPASGVLTTVLNPAPGLEAYDYFNNTLLERIAVDGTDGRIFIKGFPTNYVYTPSTGALLSLNNLNANEVSEASFEAFNSNMYDSILWADNVAFWSTKDPSNVFRYYRGDFSGNAAASSCD